MTIYKMQKNSDGDITSVELVGQNISIPFDPANSDYQAYLKWVAEGNTPAPADAASDEEQQ